MIWAAVLATCAGCYLLKLAGLSLPAAALSSPRLRRVTDLLPVALLSALIAVQTLGGRTLTVDARAAGLLAAGVAVLLRAPVLVVVVVAAAVTAAFRAI